LAIKSFADLFNRNKEVKTKTDEFWDYFWDLDMVQENSNRAYLKRMAINSVLDYVARAVSMSEFKIYDNNKLATDAISQEWMYLLNVRPNSDSNASDFWQKAIYKLLYDNELLIIITDSNELLIADNFERVEYAVYPDKFKQVTVKNYTFERSFSMDEVFYLQYNNKNLEDFIAGLFADYGELFGRMIEVNLRNNQIRGTVSIDSAIALNEKISEKVQTFLDNLFKSFKTNSVAIVPAAKGLEYEEHSQSQSNSQQSFEELDKLKNSLISDVARAIGFSPALILGEKANLDEDMEGFKKVCIKPLNLKLQKELLAKIFAKNEYLSGKRLVVVGIDKPDIFKQAVAIDKLVSSGTFTRNEVRQAGGYEQKAGLDNFIMTKNYQDANEALKGGENNDEN